MLNTIVSSCGYYFLAGLISAVVALCCDFLKSQPPETSKKILEALVCGFLSFAICGYCSSHFESVSEIDTLFVAVGIGTIGAGRVSEMMLQLICRKLNITSSDKAHE